MEKLVYHVLRGRTPQQTDFLTSRDLGVPPHGAQLDDPSLWTGWSAFDKIEEAEKRARRYGLGTHIAVMRMPEEWVADPARMRKTLGRHHYTVWGTFADIEDFIIQVVEVRKA
jgi:hypothetical protein